MQINSPKVISARKNVFQVQKHPSHSSKMQKIAVIKNIPYFLPVVYIKHSRAGTGKMNILSCYGIYYISLTVYHHDDVIKWKHFPRYWSFVRGIHRSPVNSSHKGQWRGALMFTLICARINGWVNNREADDLRRHRAHYDVIVMTYDIFGD